MRPTDIVVDPPGFDQLFGLGERLEPVQIQAFITQRPIERLDIGIVGRLARS